MYAHGYDANGMDEGVSMGRWRMESRCGIVEEGSGSGFLFKFINKEFLTLRLSNMFGFFDIAYGITLLF